MLGVVDMTVCLQSLCSVCSRLCDCVRDARETLTVCLSHVIVILCDVRAPLPLSVSVMGAMGDTRERGVSIVSE